MENDVPVGGMHGKRRRGRPRKRLLDILKNMKGRTINIMSWDAREQTTWGNATVDGARGRTRHSPAVTYI